MTNTAVDFIASAHGKLADPIMVEWAISQYERLPKCALKSRAQMESTWFHDHFIGELIEQNDSDALYRLFRALPAEHFANLTPLMVDRWPDWRANVAAASAEVLASNAPQDLFGLFEAALTRVEQGQPISVERFLSIDVLMNTDDEARRRAFFDRLRPVVMALPDDDIEKSLLLRSLLMLADGASAGTMESLIDAALRSETRDSFRETIFKEIFQTLFGHAQYLDLVLARIRGESQQRFEALAPFFSPEAPLAVLDCWIDSLPPPADIQPALEAASVKSDGSAAICDLLRSSSPNVASLPDSTKSVLAIAACLHSYARKNFDAATLDLETTVALLAADLDKNNWYQPLFDRLRSFPRQEIISALTTRLPAVNETYGGMSLANAMGDLRWQEFVPCLIEAIADDSGDFVCEAAQAALVEIGHPAQTLLIARWKELDMSQQIYSLSAIRDVGGAAAADFSATHFDELVADSVELCCELALAAPDPRLLEKLRPELRRRQALIDRTYYVLARLLDRDDAEAQAAKERAMEDRRKSQERREALEAGVFSQNILSLELRCPACKAVNRYEVEGVILAGRGQQRIEPFINDEFPCASCGEYVEFEFTPTAHMALTAELLLSTVAAENGQPRDSRVTQLDCRLNGQVIPLAVGLKKLKERVSRHPNDARTWFQLGNLTSHLKTPKATLAAYRQACRAAPRAIDAKFALARSLVLAKKSEEAFELLTEALSHVDTWQFLKPNPDFRHDFAAFYNRLRLESGKHDLPALHPSSLIPSRKVGRNDPCPCGSGKKFKKCCGA